ncbi:hypothetical protein LTR17_027442 [Elasticomyces elasticus]|nr:hypothetical protein LTR17_027442 [Elasticomyces elasticus]
MDANAFRITHVVDESKDLADVANLFRAYAESLGIDLTFQDFSTELASLPGKYGAPKGVLLLARNNQYEAVGCVGLRPLPEPRYCEIKRLYVSPQGRGSGLGRVLAERVVHEAKAIGYEAMRLDTLPQMSAARSMYKSLGFREVEPYYRSPLEGSIFLELTLNS